MSYMVYEYEILVESRKFRPAKGTFGASINDSSLEFHYYIGVAIDSYRPRALGARASVDYRPTNIFFS